MFFSGHPLFPSPPPFPPSAIPYLFHPSAAFIPLLLIRLTLPLLPASTPCVTGGASGRWEKLLVGSFFPPSVLTCSPAGQHILSTSVGLAGQTEPFCPPQPFWSELQEWEPHLWRYWGWWGRQADIFSWITLSSGFLLCVFQVLSLQMTEKRRKGFKYKHMWHLSNVTVSIPDTWFMSAS